VSWSTSGLRVTLSYLHYSRLYIKNEGPSRSWSYGSWIYNYLCNQCQTKVVSSNSADGEVYSIQHYVLKFFSDLRQDGHSGFLHQ